MKWTPNANAKLARLYPSASRAELVAALSPHGWTAIRRHAWRQGLSRYKGRISVKAKLSPIVKRLVEMRTERRFTRGVFAERVGYHCKTLASWELGKVQPRLQQLIDWAHALGMEVALQPAEPVEAVKATELRSAA